MEKKKSQSLSRVGKLSPSDFYSCLSSLSIHIYSLHTNILVYVNLSHVCILRSFISKSWFNGFQTFLLPTSPFLCEPERPGAKRRQLRDEDVHRPLMHLKEARVVPAVSCYCVRGKRKRVHWISLDYPERKGLSRKTAAIAFEYWSNE